MKIDIITLFPSMFENVLNESIIKIARKKKKIDVRIHDLREWTSDRHRTADDKPYGGGAGMVMKIEPIYKSLASLLGEGKIKKIRKTKTDGRQTRIILLSPKGEKFTQDKAREIAKLKRIIMICGHYEGVDERIKAFVTDEISIGDYILTGGEIPAMAILDAVTRLIPGVLGASSSLEEESFENNLLEYPQYTRPREFQGMKVPEVLTKGDHKAISSWRKTEAIRKTNEARKDLLK